MELVELAEAFNGMLSRLEDSFRRLSEFSSDLAHELRTPIASLMTQTQVALSRTRSAEEYREVLYSNSEEYERLARMIADMLFLAKADHGLIVPRSESVRSRQRCANCSSSTTRWLRTTASSLQLDGHGEVHGDRLMIRRAISNLLSNAISHTPNGEVRQRAHRTRGSGAIRVSVENIGDGIAPEHLPRLFDRFYRVDPSRQRSTDGAGLGLAITKSIVAAHNGTVQAFSASGLTRFEIAVPAAYAHMSLRSRCSRYNPPP